MVLAVCFLASGSVAETALPALRWRILREVGFVPVEVEWLAERLVVHSWVKTPWQ